MIYSDDFEERDAGWYVTAADIAAGRAAIGDGRVLIKPAPGLSYSVMNTAFDLPTDADICVKMRIVDASDLSKVGAGLVFWAKGFNDNYFFQVVGNGTYWIARFSNQAWQNVTPPADVPSFQQGLNQDNLLRVTTKNQTVTVFVNDQQIAKFRAPAPVGLVKAGFRAGSFDRNAPVAVEFRDFSVTEVPK